MHDKTDLTNLTDKLWQSSEFFAKETKRNRKYSLKEILKAIIYIDKTGCQWRMLPA
jgi:putative transposase